MPTPLQPLNPANAVSRAASLLQSLLLVVALGAGGDSLRLASSAADARAAEHEADPEGETSNSGGHTTAPTSSPASPVGIQAVLGFSETIRLGRWTPVTVILSNRGSDLAGDLEIQAPGGDELEGDLFTTTYRRSLELPAGSRKRFRFTVLMESFSRPLVIRVTSGARELTRRTIDLRRNFTAARLILVLSRDADLDYLNDGESLRVLYPRPELLPDRWQGYGGVEAVVLHRVSLEDLSARQYEALSKWVARGGILAVSGGPDYALLRTPRWAELLPGTPVGLVRFPDGTAVSASFRAPLHAPSPFDVNRLAGFRGRVLHRAGGIPLIIEQDKGRGRVVYLTFDVARYPFDGWSGMEQLWLRTLRLPPVERLTSQLVETRRESPVLSLLRRSSMRFPDHWTLLVFVALYIGVLVAGHNVRPAGVIGRRIAPWLTWASPLVFAPGAYLVFGPLLFPIGATAVMVSVIETHPGGPYADLRLDLGLFSSRRDDLRLDYRGAEPVFRPHHRVRHETPDWVFHAEGSVQPAASRKYVLHVLEGRDVIAYDIRASLEEAQAELRLNVRNASGRPLRNAWLIFAGHGYPLGTITEEADWERTVNTASGARPVGDGLWAEILGERNYDPRDAEAALVNEIERLVAALRLNQALLVGFSASPLRLTGASTSWQRTELALVLVRLPAARLATEHDFPGRGGPGHEPT